MVIQVRALLNEHQQHINIWTMALLGCGLKLSAKVALAYRNEQTKQAPTGWEARNRWGV